MSDQTSLSTSIAGSVDGAGRVSDGAGAPVASAAVSGPVAPSIAPPPAAAAIAPAAGGRGRARRLRGELAGLTELVAAHPECFRVLRPASGDGDGVTDAEWAIELLELVGSAGR